MQDFICDIDVLDSAGNVVFRYPKMTMSYDRIAMEWRNTANIVVGPGCTTTIDRIQYVIQGFVLREVALAQSVTLCSADTVTFKQGQIVTHADRYSVEEFWKHIEFLSGPVPKKTIDRCQSDLAKWIDDVEIPRRRGRLSGLRKQ